MKCPYCKSKVTTKDSGMGKLGSLAWFRCRFCGGQWNHPIKEKKTIKLDSKALNTFLQEKY